MRAGRLRHLVRFERATETQNDFGEPVKSWSLIASSWAAVEPLKGAEKMQAMEAQAEVDTRITARYSSELSSLNPRDRVVWGSKVYDIKEVLNIDERDRELSLMARRHL
jgi:SPP1 family predicted phage head-tail adaptor